MSKLESIKSCLICKRDSEKIDLIYENSRKRNLLIVCPFCGMYILPETWRGYSYISELETRLKTKLKFKLKNEEKKFSNSITEEQFQNKIRKSGEIHLKMPKTFSQYQVRVFGYKPPKFSSEQDIQDYINLTEAYPESINHKFNNILIYFYEHNAIDEKYVDIPEEDYSLLCIDNSKQLNRYASKLNESGLLDAILVENDLDMACLSVNGEIYIEELLNKKKENSNSIIKSGKEINNDLINKTKHILHKHPKAEKQFNTALEKYANEIYERNLLDDMRLALELFLKSILNNNKSLENQKSCIGVFQKENNASPELSNMFIKLVDYYAKYNNSNVKHDDNVKENEIGFLINLTSSFIMYFS